MSIQSIEKAVHQLMVAGLFIEVRGQFADIELPTRFPAAGVQQLAGQILPNITRPMTISLVSHTEMKKRGTPEIDWQRQMMHATRGARLSSGHDHAVLELPMAEHQNLAQLEQCLQVVTSGRSLRLTLAPNNVWTGRALRFYQSCLVNQEPALEFDEHQLYGPVPRLCLNRKQHTAHGITYLAFCKGATYKRPQVMCLTHGLQPLVEC